MGSWPKTRIQEDHHSTGKGMERDPKSERYCSGHRPWTQNWHIIVQTESKNDHTDKMSVHLKWLLINSGATIPLITSWQRELMGSWPEIGNSRKEIEYSQISIGHGNRWKGFQERVNIGEVTDLEYTIDSHRNNSYIILKLTVLLQWVCISSNNHYPSISSWQIELQSSWPKNFNKRISIWHADRWRDPKREWTIGEITDLECKIDT